MNTLKSKYRIFIKKYCEGLNITDPILLTKKLSKAKVYDVYFCNNSIEKIKFYVDNYKEYDKSGAYGIQDVGVILVDKIDGSYQNVMGQII
ncbi:Maf family protein [Streptobacillus felis]|uniref:Maf family protein n=1 Tax=Streptobacillus felis TaxID=1384509 RepID=UPI001C551BFA|nr:Maf family protein [Streptobacillus felis]